MINHVEPQLALLSPAGGVSAATPTQDGSPAQVRVLTWNVQRANASRMHQQAVWLATSDPADVLVLTEVAAGQSGQLLARSLEEFGYTVHLPEPGADDHYRVLLACRTGVLDAVTARLRPTAWRSRRWAGAPAATAPARPTASRWRSAGPPSDP